MKEFKKSDLRTGMIVINRGGVSFKVMLNTMFGDMLINYYASDDLSDYDDLLKNKKIQN